MKTIESISGTYGV